jgi:TatA/E family protein of Tat protein translocase
MGTDGIIVLVIALIVLVGGSQLPKLARNVGMAGREFRKAQQEAEDEAERAKEAKAAKDAAGAPTAALNPPPAPPAPAADAGTPAPAPEGSITLTPAQLEALLRSREEQVRGEAPGN